MGVGERMVFAAFLLLCGRVPAHHFVWAVRLRTTVAVLSLVLVGCPGCSVFQGVWQRLIALVLATCMLQNILLDDASNFELECFCSDLLSAGASACTLPVPATRQSARPNQEL
jgi:hypothetical protein